MVKTCVDSHEHNRDRIVGDGLRGPDQQQGELQDVDRGTFSQPTEQGSAGESTPHQEPKNWNPSRA